MLCLGRGILNDSDGISLRRPDGACCRFGDMMNSALGVILHPLGRGLLCGLFVLLVKLRPLLFGLVLTGLLSFCVLCTLGFRLLCSLALSFLAPGFLALGFFALSFLSLAFFALLAGLQPPLFQFLLSGLFRLGETSLDLLGDALYLFLGQGLLHRRQQLPLFVAGMLAEGLLQVLEPFGKSLIVLRQRLQFGQLCAKLLVVLDRLCNELFCLGIPPQDREEVLLFKAGMKFQLSLQLGKELFPGLYGSVRRFGQLGEQLIRLGRTCLHQCSKIHPISSACRGAAGGYQL